MLVTTVQNESLYNYLPHSSELKELQEKLDHYSLIETNRRLSSVVNNHTLENRSKNAKKIPFLCPCDFNITLGSYTLLDRASIEGAIEDSLKVKKEWENLSFDDRANIFYRVAELLSTHRRASINASTMLCQSKNIYQAEIDAACENIDFLRFNIHYAKQLFDIQPISTTESVNTMEYRPLDGFTYAVTPFNFTAIAANLACSMALMGNVVIWKPSLYQLHSASVFMEILREAGLPPGVIQMIVADPEVCTDVVVQHPDFSGLHFTGSSKVFESLIKRIGNNIENYKSFPRIVGETGGKDFILVHESANSSIAETAIIKSAFEYQGQKCSAASRVYISKKVWTELAIPIENAVRRLKMGSVLDFDCYINSVISRKAFDKIVAYIERAKKSKHCEIIVGGKYSDEKGYFVEPTIILTDDPYYETMCEEIFGPVVSIFLYDDSDFDEILDIIDNTSGYALTGALICQDRQVIKEVRERLKHSAGNFYINDKCTGAVVGQQPFGGGRKSGTNDKAGSMLNLTRWVSPRAVKENINPVVDHMYAYMKRDE